MLLEGGRVVADGTHAELMATEPRYAEVLAHVEETTRPPTSGAAERGGRRRALGRPGGAADGGRPGRPDGLGRVAARRRAAVRRRRRPAAPAGCPFAGIPPELQAGVEKLLASEPEHPEPSTSTFTPGRADDRRPFTLRRFLAPAPAGAARRRSCSSCSRRVAMQAGPLLTQIGIDHGIRRRRHAACSSPSPSLYLVAVVVSGDRQRVRDRVDRAASASGCMYDLRVRVFSPLPAAVARLLHRREGGPADDPHDERHRGAHAAVPGRPGQHGRAGPHLVVVTVVLFSLNPTLAADHAARRRARACSALTLWFRAASDRGYDVVRDRIADVLADLQESLSGIRIITAHNRRRHNVVNHRNVVGDYRDANDYTAHGRRASTAPAPRSSASSARR